jgi:hypothetical protein
MQGALLMPRSACRGDPRVPRLANRVVVNEPSVGRAFTERRIANVALRAADGRSFRIEWSQPRWEGGDEIGNAEVIEKVGHFAGRCRSLNRAVGPRNA